MKGSYGMLCIAIGILAAGLGGYLLNAETVTVCETHWDYITDVGAAFQGDKSDLEISYEPTSNITGWSDQPEYNKRFIRAIDYRPSERANNYMAFTAPDELERVTLLISAAEPDGIGPNRYEFNGTDAGSMPSWAGNLNGEIETRVTIGETTKTGAFAVPLSAIMDFASLEDWQRIDCTAAGGGGYPAFAVGTDSSMVMPGPNLAVFTASAYSSEISVYELERSVVIGDETYPIRDVWLVFGSMERGGPTVSSVNVFLDKSKGSDQEFIDPSYGVKPYAGSYEALERLDIDSPYSANPSIAFTAPRLDQTGGRVSVEIRCDTPEYSDILFGTMESRMSGGLPIISFDPGDGTMFYDFGGTGGASMAMECVSGQWSVTVGGQVQGFFEGPDQYTAFRAVATLSGGYRYSVTISNDIGGSFSMSQAGAQTLSAPMSYTDTREGIVTHYFDGAWWNNGYDNASVSVAFSRPVSGAASNRIEVAGENGTTSVDISYAAGMWNVQGYTEGGKVGNWPALLLRISGDTVSVLPLTAFTSFTSFENVMGPVASFSLGFDVGAVESLHFADGGASFRMAVVGTTVRLSQGGLYLQDSSLTLSEAFPEADAASLMIGSAVAVGRSITFISGSNSVSLPVDSEARTIRIGSDVVALNGISFRWYSSEGPSAVIGSMTYLPAIYDGTQELAAGKIWAKTDRGDYYEIMDAPTDWTVRLDGIWAPAVNFYDGSNEATESTQISDFTHGIFRWDKSQVLIVFMGAVIVGGLVGTHWGYTKGADWIAIFGACGLCWMIL